MKTVFDWKELGQKLHDSILDLDSIEFSDGVLRLNGVIERPCEYQNFQTMARFEFAVHFKNVSKYAIFDIDKMREIKVSRIDYDVESHLALLESAWHGYLIIEAATCGIEIFINDVPVAVRKWFRWTLPTVRQTTI